jgi:intron-binding protein aquarius
MKGSGFSVKRIMMLEFSQYLENFLWPNFDGTAEPSLAMVMSLVVIVNEKFRERVPAWAAFQYRPDHFPALFQVGFLCTYVPERSLQFPVDF